MKFTKLSLLFLIAFAACKNDSSHQNSSVSETESEANIIQQTDIMLLCQTAEQPKSDGDASSFEVFLQLAESKVKVADVLNCETINPDSYEQYQIPSKAISAVGGWWAGGGEYLYVVEEEDNYVVKKGEIFEESEDDNYNYEVVAKYSKKGKEVL